MESTVAAAAALRGATVVLGERAVLRGLDLVLPAGVTVLRGANGAGKTTAVRALAGLVPLARGSRIAPADLLYLGHRPQLLHGLTARENLAFFARMRGASDRAVDRAMARWGLAAEADRPVERLSAGQRRRAALARMETEPCALTLLDEPFAELDDDAAAQLRADIVAARERGRAVLVATHGHTEVDALADRVYVIRDGRAS